jgi:hypothetical protein
MESLFKTFISLSSTTQNMNISRQLITRILEF